MFVYVHLLGTKDQEDIRCVEIPDSTDSSDILSEVVNYGQNPIQPQSLRSVTGGDVINHNGLHLVVFKGFVEITKEEFKEYRKLRAEQRFAFRLAKKNVASV